METKERRREVCDGAALASFPNITFTCPLFLHKTASSGAKRGTLDSPSTPEEAGGGAAPGSGLSASPCCVRCRCREPSAPSTAVVAPLAAAASAAPVPVSGMLSISEERRKVKLFSEKLCSGMASQGKGKAWV